MSYPLDFSKAIRDGAAAASNKTVPVEIKDPGTVRGGTKIPDYTPDLDRGNATQLTIGAVEITVGGDPRVALFNKIHIDNAPQIAAKINEHLITNDKGFISSYSASVEGFGINFGGTYQTSVGEQKTRAASRAFDVMYLEKLVDWTNNPLNKNGAKFEIEGGLTVVYDKAMVDEIRINANAQLRIIKPRLPGANGIHGSVGDEELPSQSVALTPGSKDTVVASATPEIQTSGAQSLEFKNNPRVQEIYAALDRNGESQTPSLVAGLAGAAANLREVRDVVLTPQTAFALDGDKFNPAANRASVSMDVANKPFDEVWKTASVALQQTAPPAVVAQAQDLEQKQSQSAPRM